MRIYDIPDNTFESDEDDDSDESDDDDDDDDDDDEDGKEKLLYEQFQQDFPVESNKNATIGIIHACFLVLTFCGCL